MPQEIQAYQVFIASPGGLDAEREAFRRTLAEHNEADALARGCMFRPIGWEITLGGVGRPQELINKDVRTCDYFVLVLWDRWGSLPDRKKTARYSSGTEEEYHVALECFDDPSLPMRQIVVFFKAPSLGQVGDPGPELQKVLEFKKELEAGKNLLFATFDEVSGFELILRRHLAHWVRDYEEGTTAKVAKPETPPQPPSELRREPVPVPAHKPGRGRGALAKALRLEREGRLTEAETEYARAVATGDRVAIEFYGTFLTRTGRWKPAREMLARALELEDEQGDELGQGTTLNSLAVTYYQQGDFQRAQDLFRQALAFRERADAPETEGYAINLYNLATLVHELGSYAEAESLYDKALTIAKEERAVGLLRAGLARLHLDRGSLDGAEELAQAALDVLDNSDTRPEELAFALAVRAKIYERRASFDDAKRLFRRGTDMVEEAFGAGHGSLAGILNDLGALYARLGDAPEAERLYRRALHIGETAFSRADPGVARSLRVLADLCTAQERFLEAESMLKRALSIYETAFGPEHPSTARTLLGFARLYAAQGQSAEARQLYERGIAILEKSVPEHPDTEDARQELARLGKPRRPTRRSSPASRARTQPKKRPKK